ncbi:response regulator [Fulvivirga sp. M361]|uniref:response regulator n=1 Tax=Fulvivirga sp. M361 TaxID=2594266 RepID=UPI00117AEADB|nr:response regulator [Fulvivirga sp. M361]TRX60534.1 response regulator [Fulvivirga sp. M361]
MISRSIQIMIAEDDLDDRLLIEDAFKENGISLLTTSFAGDGDELLTLLKDRVELPDIIMLDLNMPKKDGREALKEIRANNLLKHIPIIIFTTSNAEEDIRLAYQEGGNTYITKPSLFSELVDTVGIIKRYWFEKAALVH